MIFITDLITDNEKLASTVTTVVHTLRTTYKRREKTYISTTYKKSKKSVAIEYCQKFNFTFYFVNSFLKAVSSLPFSLKKEFIIKLIMNKK